MSDDRKIIDIKEHTKNNPQAQNYEGEPCIVQCPHCRGVEWAVCQDEKSAGISHLVCVSEECDGDSYIEVEDGFLADDVFHFKMDIDISDDPANDTD